MQQPQMTKHRHYHVTIGPMEANVYDASNDRPMAGPYYDIIVDSAEEAVALWASVANTILQSEIIFNEQVSKEEVLGITESIVGSEWQFEYEDQDSNIGYEIGDGEQSISINDCGGCVPRGSN